jgi:hypothetical protein
MRTCNCFAVSPSTLLCASAKWGEGSLCLAMPTHQISLDPRAAQPQTTLTTLDERLTCSAPMQPETADSFKENRFALLLRRPFERGSNQPRLQTGKTGGVLRSPACRHCKQPDSRSAQCFIASCGFLHMCLLACSRFNAGDLIRHALVTLVAPPRKAEKHQFWTMQTRVRLALLPIHTQIRFQCIRGDVHTPALIIPRNSVVATGKERPLSKISIELTQTSSGASQFTK